jgi:DNA polymerase elongation subunit (family B)
VQFTRKGYGRIYVDDPEHIRLVMEEIRAMDEDEFSYLPSEFITTFDQYPMLTYTHKFDELDFAALTARLWKRGIKIFCVDNGRQEYMLDATEEPGE